MKSVTFCKGFLLSLSSKSCALKKNSKIFKLAFAVLFLGLFFGFSGKASAATYDGTTYTEVFYVCATGDNSAPVDGTCAHAFNGTAFNTLGNWATTQAVDGKIGPGDVVVYLSDGGDFHTALTPLRNGLSSAYITLRGAIGQVVVIDGQSTRAIGLDLTNRSYYNISNLTIKNHTTDNIHVEISANINFAYITTSGAGKSIGSGGTTTYVTIDHLTSTQNTGATAAIYFNSTLNHDLTITHSTITGATNRGMYLKLGSNIYISDVEVTGCGAAGIDVESMTSGSLTLADIYSGVTREGVNVGNALFGLYINASTALLHATNINTKNNASDGINVTNSSLISGSFIDGFDSSNNLTTNNGIMVVSSPNLTIKNGTANYNNVGVYIQGAACTSFILDHVTMSHNRTDGFNTHGSVPNATVRYSVASYNGTAGAGIITGSGDGFSSHDSDSVNYYYDLSYNNLNTGFAHIDTSMGTIYNSLVWNNGSVGDATMNRAGLYLTSTANPGWTVKNTIIGQNYPADIREHISSHNTFDYNQFFPLDANKFYTQDEITFTSWAAIDSSKKQHSTNSDPLFVSSSDFHLQPTSPAINAGTNSIWSGQNNITDYEGNPITNGSGTVITNGGTVDIGAYEYQDTSPPTGGSFTLNSSATITNSTAATLNITCPTDTWPTVQMAYGNSANPTNWTTCASGNLAHTLLTGDGTKTVYVRFKDGGNNTTTDYSHSITLDSTPPTITITDPNTNPAQNKTITASATESATKFYAINNAGNNTCDVSLTFTPYTSLTFSSESDNGKKVCYKAQDSANNTSYSLSNAISGIDTTAPETTIDTHPNAIINTNSTSFTFSANETSTFQCKLDSESYATCTSPKSLTSLAEGNHTFSVKGTDSATNVDATPASYSFTVDTIAPTLTNLSPNGITFPVTTTSTNLTLTTSETATCKYSVTSGTDYTSMTAFDTTNATSHSTFISGLNAGIAYNYYILCQDTATNESTEEHLTFSISPLENNNISLENIKIKVGREINKFKDTIRIAKNKLKLNQKDDNLANGTVKIYKDNKRIDTIDINSDGSWDEILKLKDEFSGWIKIRQYDQFGTLLSTDKAKIKVDTEDPKFNEAIPEKMTIGRNQKISFPATDDNSGIDYYKVKLADIRDWRQQNEDFYQIPADVSSGTYDLFIRAYDKTGNYAEEKTTLNVVRFKNSVNLTQVPLNLDGPTQNIESQIHTDKNTDTAPSSSSSNNFPSPQPQAKPSTFHWYDPFSWF